MSYLLPKRAISGRMNVNPYVLAQVSNSAVNTSRPASDYKPVIVLFISLAPRYKWNLGSPTLLNFDESNCNVTLDMSLSSYKLQYAEFKVIYYRYTSFVFMQLYCTLLFICIYT